MNVQRVLCASALAAGVGLTGVFGAGIAIANAAPTAGHAPFATAPKTPDPQPVPGVNLDHHQQRKLKKYLKEHPEVTLPPNTGQG